MAVYTFDGPNLRIVLPSGVTQITADDLYSRWKEWFKDSDNSKFPLAFTTSGGEPLVGVLESGAYFTIQNQLGWRIRPPEEDINVTITGNLVLADDTLGPTGIVVPTLGNFTALVLGIQPITQTVAIDSLAEDVKIVRQIGENRLEIVDFGLGVQRMVLYGDDGVTPIRSWPLTDNSGGPITTKAGIQTKRGASTI